jgi:hypothetical protein
VLLFQVSGLNFTSRTSSRTNSAYTSQNRDSDSSGLAPNGVRPIWNVIWRGKVRPKIRVFSWRVATNTLSKRKNKHRRTLEINNQCVICGKEAEDAHHAMVRCTKASALRHAMHKHWTLPGEKSFRYMGNGRFQILIGHNDELTESRILMLFWRA